MKEKLIVLGILVCVFSGNATAVTTIRMDLARQEEGSTRTEPIEAGEQFQIYVVNSVRKTTYTYGTVVERIPIPPLEASKFQVDPGEPPPPCDSLSQSLIAGLAEAKTEQEVGEAVDNVRAASAACAGDQQRNIEAVIAALTTFSPDRVYRLKSGEKLTFTVSRGTGEKKKTWVLVVTTGPTGEWRTHYGFNWVPNKDEKYFLRPRSDEKFDIVQEREDDDLTFIPSIFANWTSAKAQESGRGFGATAGFGFDMSDPVVFGGISYLFHENLSFNFGAIIHRQARLNARLDTDTPVAENLGDDQLHKLQYHPNLFFGVGFRFDKNPLKKKDAPTEAGDESTKKEEDGD